MIVDPSQSPTPIPRGRQREIAARAGVSVSTVSRVLNNVAGISEELQQRVRAAARDLGYVLNGAQPQGQLRSVALVSSLGSFEPRSSPFYMSVVAGIEAECRRLGIDLSYIPFEPSMSGAAFILDKVQQPSGAGLLLLAIDDRSLVEQLLATGLPICLVNAEHPDLRVDTFLPDNWFAPYRAVRYLIEHGHRRILHFTSLSRPTIQRRHQAYRAALEDAGIVYDPALVVTSTTHEPSVYKAMRAFLDSHPRDFTAIFCSTDTTAIGVVHALQEAGLRVPEDVSVVGFDDIPLAALISPPLTTVRIEREELGAIAVRRLIERAAAPELTPIRVELACRLIQRQSVASITGET